MPLRNNRKLSSVLRVQLEKIEVIPSNMHIILKLNKQILEALRLEAKIKGKKRGPQAEKPPVDTPFAGKL